MCRSIKQLRRSERGVTEEEIQAAALQFVRKVSGYRKPAKANVVPFNVAVSEISIATRRLLVEIGALDEGSPQRHRVAEDGGETKLVNGVGNGVPSAEEPINR